MYYQDFVDSLNHRQPRRIPIDFGANSVTGIHVLCMARLREHYGLDPHPVIVSEPYQMLGLMEDDLMEAMGVTVIGVRAPGNAFGFNNLPPYKPYKTLWGQEVQVPLGFNTTRDEAGNELIYPQGDLTVPPSGIMPSSGYFFDTTIRQEPIVESQLDYRDNLEEFGPLDELALTHFQQEAKRLRKLDMGAIGDLPGTGMGNVSRVPGPGLKHPKGVRDVAEWYMFTATHPNYIQQVFNAQTEIALQNLPKMWEALGESVQVVRVCGNDFGHQTGQFCSNETFDNLYAPYYKRINDWVHANTSWKTFKHSCGAIAPLLPNFIDAGFDIINPVQCSASGMDPVTLKKEFGNKLVFWGAGVDTQRTLPFGTPEEVREEVLSRCEIFGRNGGFIFSSIHNIQANTPVENVVAMIDAVKEFNQ